MAVVTEAAAGEAVASERRWLSLAVLLCGQTLASMDASIVTVAVPSIQTGLRASGAQIQLMVAGYLLVFAALVVTGARLGDRFGYARMFRLGLAGFTLASLGCGLAPDASALILARAAQGLSAALLVPQVVSLIQLRFDGAARARAIGMYSMVLALGVAIGQIVGGVLVSADILGLGWRPAFLINVPIGLLSLALTRLLPAGQKPAVVRFDLVGVALLAVAMTGVLTPLVVGRDTGWPAWCTGLLAAGILGLAGFYLYERRLARGGRQPLLDFRALTPAGVRTGLLACFLVMGAYSAFVFTIALHLQGALGFSPLRAGLTFVPFAAGFAIISLTWDRLPRPARRVLPVAGPFCFAAGAVGVVALSGAGWPTGWGIALLLVAGMGHAASFSPLLARVGERIGPGHASALSAASNTGSLLANAVSVAGLGGIYLTAIEGAQATPAASHGGLTRVVVALAVVLTVTAACALWTVTRPQPG